jgi:hypothetical protein
VAGAWLGLVRDDAPEAVPPSRSGRAERAVDLGEVMDFVPGCTIDTCSVLARRGGFRFDGNDATLILVATPACNAPTEGGSAAVGLHLVTGTRVLWSRGVDGATCVDPVGGIETDRTRNAFLKVAVAAGRYQVIVLRILGDKVNDFDSFEGRFVGAGSSGPRDRDDDGVFEIVVANACDRDCPAKDAGEVVYHWTGGEYEER